MVHSCIKNFIFFITFLFSLNGFSANTDIHAIESVVSTFCKAYENRDLNTINNLFSPSSMVIGTGVDEVNLGRAKIMAGFKRDFNESQKATVTAKKIAIKVYGSMAVASYFLNVNVSIPNAKPFQTKLRWSIALIKENNQWVIAQSHLSAPISTEAAGNSFPHANS